MYVGGSILSELSWSPKGQWLITCHRYSQIWHNDNFLNSSIKEKAALSIIIFQESYWVMKKCLGDSEEELKDWKEEQWW